MKQSKTDHNVGKECWQPILASLQMGGMLAGYAYNYVYKQ
jgi:hypothetical protein